MSSTHERDRPYWNMQIEPFLDTPELRVLQLHRLRTHLAKLYEGAPFWRERMQRHGMKPDDVRRIEDLGRMLPPCRKQDLREAAEAHGTIGSMERMIAAPGNELRLLAATSGTTGEPTPYPFTPAGMEVMNENWARIMWRCGIRPGDRILHGFGLSMFIGGVPLLMSRCRTVAADRADLQAARAVLHAFVRRLPDRGGTEGDRQAGIQPRRRDHPLGWRARCRPA